MENPKTPASSEKAATVDWSAVRRRLDATQSAIEGGWKPSAAEKEEILRVRANAMAREAAKAAAAGEYVEVVEFLLAGERYGIESAFIREVQSLREVAPLAGTPPFIMGITNIRGEVLAVVDLRTIFGLPAAGLTDASRVLVLNDERMRFGLVADAVLATRKIPAESIQPSLPTLTGVREKYLRGVTAEGEVILSATALLTDESLIVAEDA